MTQDCAEGVEVISLGSYLMMSIMKGLQKPSPLFLGGYLVENETPAQLRRYYWPPCRNWGFPLNLRRPAVIDEEPIKFGE